MKMTMGTQSGFPGADPLSTFSALNLLRNYNQFLGPPGNNLVQVYHHYSCDTPVSSSALEDSRRDGFSFSPSIGAFQPYFPYSLQTSPTISDLKSRQALLSVSSIYSRRSRGEKKPIPDDQKDDRYYERRKRNNQAAKKSRDARKLREDQIALRATLLEHENAILRAQLITLREETHSLRQLIFGQKKAFDKSSPNFEKKSMAQDQALKKWENFEFSVKNLNDSVE